MPNVIGVSSREDFADQLPKEQIGVEVGVWHGDHAQVLLEQARPVTLYLVDPWKVNDDITNRTSTMETTQQELDRVFDSVVHRFRDFPAVTILRMTSVEAAERLSLVHWVYIDAIHTYESVKADIAAWRDLIIDEGMICGHDDWVPGIRQAVKEHLQEYPDDRLEVVGAYSWAIRCRDVQAFR